MRVRNVMMLACSACALSTAAYAQETAAAAEASGAAVAAEAAVEDTVPADERQETVSDQDIVVTARKREETLKNVPVAATAVTGETIEKKGLASVKDVAMLTPGLSINSDGAGRAFVAIRGVGTTLIDSVQPGVGIFVDGIYQQNTSYLNNPLVDVQRVEVLRGPQGTLYGKNTLGGAINIITRQPTNELRGTFIGSYAGPDDAWFASGSVSGPIIRDRLQARIGYAHRQQDGFMKNIVIDKDVNTLNTDTLSATVRAEPVDDLVLTLNGHYDWVKGNAVPYAVASGPTDYNRDVTVNSENLQEFKYKGINAKLAFPIASMNTDVTLVGAFDERDAHTPDLDVDFTPIDIGRRVGDDIFRTRTAELRFDSKISATLSSIVGLFYSRETRDADADTTLLPGIANIHVLESGSTEGDTYAAFGNLFWKPTEAWELSAGLRYDKQDRQSEGNVAGVAIPTLKISEDHLSPRVAATYHWNPSLMSYASISRGFRGGGFNPPSAPANIRTYKGDSVWTYEVGTKYSSPRFSLAGALFYNDYKDYIGLNTIVATQAGFTTVDLNTGDVESYGIELEGMYRVFDQWTLSGGVSLQHARVTNSDIYEEVTGRQLASDRVTFQPDWNFNINSDYVIPIGRGDLTWNIGLLGKGSRLAATISETEAPILEEYVLLNTSLTYAIGRFEISAFANNLGNADYMESYIERTTLDLALEGLLGPNMGFNLGLPGDKRRVGIRTRFKF